MEEELTSQTLATESTSEKAAVTAPKDFWAIIADCEIPAWWKVDIDVSTDALTRKKAAKRHKKLIARLEAEHKAMLADNQKAERARAEAEAKYAAQIKAQRELLAKKEEEQRLYEQQQLAAYDRTLTDARAELEERRRDNDLLDMNNKALQKENQIHIDGDRQQQEISHKIDAVMDENATEQQRTIDLEQQFKMLMAERETLFPMSKTDDGGYLGYTEKKFEAFDSRNILEIKEISLFDKDLKKYVLHIPSISCPKGRVTVVQSYPQNLVMLERLLYRTTQSSVQMHTGEIRFEGQVTSAIPREEYRKLIGKDIESLTFTLDEMRRSGKNIFSTFGLKKNDKSLLSYLKELNVDSDACLEKTKNLPAEVAIKLAVAYILSRVPKLVVLEPVFGLADVDFRRAVYAVLNNEQLNHTVLVLSENGEMGVSVFGARLYVV